MIPVKLRIEGFLSYRQPVELDFKGFDLACISGPNGAGKSSLLDAMTWALFGRARQRDESVINNNPAVKAAVVTLDFDYENDRYRVQRTNPRGKTSTVEFYILSRMEGEDGRWKPLTERTKSETDQKIQNTLKMDFDTFTNASFFLQGKADQFATARPADRKRILSNILGLEIWEFYREGTRQRRSLEEKEVQEVDGRLSEIQSELDEEPARRERLSELEARMAGLVKQRETQARELEVVQRLHAVLEEQRKAVEILKAQLESAERSRERTLTTLEDRRIEKNGLDRTLSESEEIEKAYKDWLDARQQLEAMEEIAEQFRQHETLRHEPQGVIQAEEARLVQEQQSLESQKSALEEALAEGESLKVQMITGQEKIKTLQKAQVEGEKLEDQIQQLQADQAEAKAENPRLKSEMEDIRLRLNQLEAADEPECPVCGQPLSEDHRNNLIRDYYKEGEGRRDRYKANKMLLVNFESNLKKLGAKSADHRASEIELQDENRLLDQITNKLDLLKTREAHWAAQGVPRLEQIAKMLSVKAFALEARKRLEEIGEELGKLGYDTEAHKQLRQTEVRGREAEENLRKLEAARSALAPIEREISGLEVALLEQEKTNATLRTAYDDAVAKYAVEEVALPDLAQAEAALHDIQEQENRLLMSVGGARQKVNVLETLKERKAGLEETKEGMAQTIADLKQLERAFGKDGIPALLIEQALPEIEEITNNLLSRLTNGRMSFRFQTQREYKDTKREDKKETLDMVISDTVGVRDYEMFSGGEAFRINFSIRLALSEVLARRAGARLQTLVIDEGFGSQDEEGRQRLVEAINLVRDDFEKILVITHLEELKEVFPTRIEVEKTLEGSKLRVI